MLDENYIHVNSNGEVLNFKEWGISVNESVIRDYSWKYNQNNGKLLNFYKDIESFQLELTVNLRGVKSYSQIKDKIVEHFEIDIINSKQGYLEKNGYKLSCFIIENKKKDYLIADRYLKMEVTVLCQSKLWVKETSYSLTFENTTRDIYSSKKYKYVYPYTYTSQKNAVNINNPSFYESDIIVRLFGPAINPFVKIGDIIYQINATLDKGEYFEIDTENRTIYKVSNFGNKSNAFMYRSKQRDDFFVKIPPGVLSTSWGGNYNVEIIVFEKRSEPRWN